VGKAVSSVAVECAGYALCSDVLELGWTAITPCHGCVTGAAVGDSERAATEGHRAADPAQAVTGDELERLLCQARLSRASGRTSSR
jgi:hypothetical protein